eukprot:gene5587-6276_t
MDKNIKSADVVTNASSTASSGELNGESDNNIKADNKETNCTTKHIDKRVEEEVTEILSEDVKREYIEQAQDLKRKGNEYFKRQEYDDAIEKYTGALEICPKCQSKDLAVLFANRAACYVHMKENLQVIKDCTAALEKDELYIKARLRRAQAYENEDKLEDALEDYKRVLELDRSCAVAIQAVMRLPDQIKERNEKLKDEMLGKLKDLGNMVLKPFGLSTENFNMQQDPNTGGYSINFQK